jgi:hypothetical protein
MAKQGRSISKAGREGGQGMAKYSGQCMAGRARQVWAVKARQIDQVRQDIEGRHKAGQAGQDNIGWAGSAGQEV